MTKHVSKPHPFILFTNHMDAWGVTFIIVSLFIFIHQRVDSQTVLLLGGMTSAYWFGFAVNDYFDVEVDAASLDKIQRNFFIHYPVSKRIASITISVFILIAILLGFSQFGLRGFVAAVVALLIVWAYSAPPLRLKSRPIFDLLTHALFVQTFPYLICVILIDVSLLTVDYVLLIFFFFSSLGAQLEQQIRDYEIDKLHDMNFTVKYGKERSANLLTIITLIPFIMIWVSFFLGVFPLFVVPLLILGVPLALHRFIRGSEVARSEIFIKVSAIIALIYVIGLWIGLIGFY